MKKHEVLRLEHTAYLPDAWDDATGSYFQKRSFLEHCEIWNPCDARYYILSGNDRFLAGAVVYSLRINLFTFSHLRLTLPMQVVGVPASVSCSGLFGKEPKHCSELLQYIMGEEEGLVLGLNFEPALDLRPGISMVMLPTVRIERKFPDWNAYIRDLRAPYRRRMIRIENKFRNVSTESGPCSAYTTEHHALYLQIMQHTDSKLEVLTEDYFRNLPDNFYLVSSRYSGQLLCWHICCTDDDRCWFFFGGHDYALNADYQSYYNNLRLIWKEALEAGYGWLDLGQTAEIPKLKMGGLLVHKTFFLYHRVGLYRFFLRLLRPLISYRIRLPAFHVLKSNDHAHAYDSSAALAGNDRSATPDDRGAAGTGSPGGPGRP